MYSMYIERGIVISQILLVFHWKNTVYRDDVDNLLALCKKKMLQKATLSKYLENTSNM